MTIQTPAEAQIGKRQGTAIKRIIQSRTGDTRWKVVEAWSDRILGSGAPNWFALEDDPRAQRVKAGHRRCTWRVALGDTLIFAKVVDLDGDGFADRVRIRIGATSAEREWRVSRTATDRGVPVATCVGVGVRRGGQRRTVLLSDGIDNALSLWDAWRQGDPGERERRPADRAPLVDAAARLYADAHELGFVHEDGHPRNILIHPDPTDELGAVFVDVAGGRQSTGPANRRRIVRSLAQLDNAFRQAAPRTERLRFIRRYRANLPSRDRLPDDRRLLSEIDDARVVHAAALTRQRDRRLSGNVKYFATMALDGGWSVTAALELERRHVFLEPSVPDRTEHQWREMLSPLLAGMNATDKERDALLRCGIRMELGRPNSSLDAFWWTLRGSPYRRTFVHCHRLRHRNLNSALVLGCAEHHNSIGLVDAAAILCPT